MGALATLLERVQVGAARQQREGRRSNVPAEHVQQPSPAANLANIANLSMDNHEDSQLSQYSQDVLAEYRDRLLVIAAMAGVDPTLVHDLTSADLTACTEVSGQVLRAYVHGLRDADQRAHGKVPDDETAPALCRLCGPIWVAPEVAAVAPVVDGWPRLLGCPWCHVRHAGLRVPRPPVTSAYMQGKNR
jgi:hypothetical protein